MDSTIHNMMTDQLLRSRCGKTLKYIPYDRRCVEYSELVLLQHAKVIRRQTILDGNGSLREAKLRVCSMWYSLEHIAAVQRHLEQMWGGK